MRRSFQRLVVGSVLAAWAAGFAVLFLYLRSVTWTEERARRDGVFLVRELLAQAPPEARRSRLEELRTHFDVPFQMTALDQMERAVGRRVLPNEVIAHRPEGGENWFYLAFEDGADALAAGPVNPARPAGVAPIGLFIAVLGLPLVAAFVALRVERALDEVEKANRALSTGALGVRVTGRRGPSDELAASFNAMADRIEQLVRSRAELLQAVSHELGSPLSRLRFHVELLQGLPGDGRQARLEAMTRELDALEDLVAELLTYVQAEDRPLDRKRFDPTRALQDLAELATLEAPDGRTVGVELAVTADPIVFADPRLFQRAVENLLRNAVRHGRTAVRVELHRDRAATRVVVHDDGPGIPESVRDQVTKPFFRVEADRSRKTGGVGLGLAIVSRIIERHQGSLTIGTSPLGGAMVALSWPDPA